jgi:hypothetical protein
MLCPAYDEEDSNDKMTTKKCQTKPKEMNVSWAELFYYPDSVFVQVALPLWQEYHKALKDLIKSDNV